MVFHGKGANQVAALPDTQVLCFHTAVLFGYAVERHACSGQCPVLLMVSVALRGAGGADFLAFSSLAAGSAARRRVQTLRRRRQRFTCCWVCILIAMSVQRKRARRLGSTMSCGFIRSESVLRCSEVCATHFESCLYVSCRRQCLMFSFLWHINITILLSCSFHLLRSSLRTPVWKPLSFSNPSLCY